MKAWPLLLLSSCAPASADLFWSGPASAPMGDDASGSGAGGDAGGGSASSSSAGGDAPGGGSGSSGGGEVECDAPTDCPGEDTSCGTRLCRDGRCEFRYEAQGHAVPEQVVGDCAVATCDGAGHVVSTVYRSDLPDDGDPCTADRCSAGGAPSHERQPRETPCPGGFCDGVGICVECTSGAQCQSGVCAGGACQVSSCSDGVQNGSETAMDCGGSSCPTCSNGATCGSSADCTSGVCASGICACGTTHLLISEVRTSGPNGAEDEFVELYNPTSATVALGNFVVDSGAVRLFGPMTINLSPHQRYVLGGYGFTGIRQATFRVGTSLPDVGRVTIGQMGGIALDTLCYCSGSTCSLPAPADCEGRRFENPNGSGQWTDASMARGPAGYSCSDTNDNAVDFIVQVTPTPGAP